MTLKWISLSRRCIESSHKKGVAVHCVTTEPGFCSFVSVLCFGHVAGPEFPQHTLEDACLRERFLSRGALAENVPLLWKARGKAEKEIRLRVKSGWLRVMAIM